MTRFEETRRAFLWAGLGAAVCCAALQGVLLLALVLRSWRVQEGLGDPVLLATLFAYGLLLVGLKSRVPIGISLLLLLSVGWFEGPWLNRIWDWLYLAPPHLLPRHPGPGIQELTALAIPFLALESMRREAPGRRPATYFRRAQVVAVLAFFALHWMGAHFYSWQGHYALVTGVALALCTLGYTIAGSLALLFPGRTLEHDTALPVRE